MAVTDRDYTKEKIRQVQDQKGPSGDKKITWIVIGVIVVIAVVLWLVL